MRYGGSVSPTKTGSLPPSTPHFRRIAVHSLYLTKNTMASSNSIQTTAARPCVFYESFLVPMNVNLFAILRAPESISTAYIENALRLTREEHPYARSRLSKMGDPGHEEGKLAFIEDPELPFDLTEESVDSIGGDESWKERLPAWAGFPRDHTRGFVSILIRRSRKQEEEKGMLQLFATCDHGALDAPGIFALFDSFFKHLGDVCASEGKNMDELMEKVESRANLCIVGDYPSDIASRPYFEMPTDYLKSPKDPSPPAEEEYTPLVPISAVFSSFSQQETAALLAACRAHGATIQGALSVATDLACLKVSSAFDGDKSVKVVSSCPCSMRPHHPRPPVATAQDILCGSALLVWSNDYALSDPLWPKVSGSTKKIKEAIASDQGLIWWYLLNNMEFAKLPQQTMMTSSVGVNPIKAQYGPLEVVDVTMLGSRYGAPGEKRGAAGGEFDSKEAVLHWSVAEITSCLSFRIDVH